MHQLNQTAFRGALQRPTDYQHAHTGRFGAEDRGEEERGDGDEHHGLAAPDIGELAPDGRGGCACQEKAGADPCVAGGGMKVGGDGWNGRDDDDCVKGGDEESELDELVKQVTEKEGRRT